MVDSLKAQYSDREQTYIKHLFLRGYLKAAAFKTMQGRSATFNFVDGFAGPWNLADVDGYSDSSFDQSIRILQEVKSTLEERGARNLTIRFFFCEKNTKRFQRLEAYAKQQRDLEIRVFHGSFEDHLGVIADACTTGFTFTFIDPTGFNLRSIEIAQFLARTRGEFLLNFMAEHINRHAGWAGVEEAYGRLLADPGWREAFEALPTDLPNETKVLILLKRRLKELRAAKYLPDFEILKPREQRLKMRLVLGTNNRHGVEVFRDVQAKAELAQHEIRSEIKSGIQVPLFPDGYMAQFAQSLSGVGCQANCVQARKRVLELLQFSRRAYFEGLIAPVLEEVAIRTTHLKNVLCEMRLAGELEFDLEGKARKPDDKTMIRLPDAKPTETADSNASLTTEP
ncbi:three-Cys-motif partner protein [Rhizobium leguminosarum]|uniref:three-Cys-motif partner protein TcmP n=1 Tax=Rhizobium leguminosarum TaxID=384 RepID=UPI0016153186|nr:three-Cys-motif partner protein TcmP [Rhizobium leguminosarum]MBB4590409.1 three-Cys-motif partner protein [Rhizobium leguminosarum]